MSDPLNRTPLHEFHVAHGAKMVPFAGYDMPVQYPLGVLKEHLFTREKAGLFDVSHMGQVLLRGSGGTDVAKAFEALVPGNIAGLKPGGLRYTMLLNSDGGILDDLMVTRYEQQENTLYLVVNAACKDADLAHIEQSLAGIASLERLDDRALLALQGPRASAVLGAMAPEVMDMGFMTSASVEIDGVSCHISRSGYTGEDGYEISLPGDKAEAFAEQLAASDDVEPIGLGARDSLRLEAGLCLYGSDIDVTTSPVEAGLLWAIPKARREAGDFPGAERILRELADGPARKRVGILPDGRAPVRHGADILDEGGSVIGTITSGGFGPSLGRPVAMGYVKTEFAGEGTEIGLTVRGRILPGRVAPMPFVEQRYYRKPKSS
ncbi:MAG: glycine cleavage system aminomethyltransferase GcvT [Proteobacteria bacterium]|nr:glycine cleavage system aminomethyltransferase GcvT [Pseudomonadota bacterium]